MTRRAWLFTLSMCIGLGGAGWQGDSQAESSFVSATVTTPTAPTPVVQVAQSSKKKKAKNTPVAPAPVGEVTEAVCKGCMVVLEDALPLSLSPLNAVTIIDQRTQALIHDGLFNLGDAGSIESSLVEIDANGDSRYSSSPDRRAAEGWIKPNALFHDDQPVTVADLKATLLAFGSASAKGRIATRAYAGMFKTISEVGKDPLHAFVVAFSRPQAETKVPLAVRLLPRHAFENPDDPASWHQDAAYSRRPIGSGPFKVLGNGLAASKTQLTLAQFPKYHRSVPRLPGIQIVAQPVMTEKIRAFKMRQAHVLVSINKEEKAQLPESAVTIPYFIRNWWHVGINLSHPLLQDLKVRKALAMALDRRLLAGQLAEQIEYAGGAPENINEQRGVRAPSGALKEGGDASVVLLSGPFVPESAFYDFKVPHIPFDPDGARLLLKEVKNLELVTSGASPVLKYKGTPVTLNFGYRKDIPGAKDVMVGLESQLSYLGIKLLLFDLSPDEFLSKVPSRDSNGRLDLFLSRYNFDEYDDIRPIFHSEGMLNYFKYKDAETDRLFVEAEASATYQEETSVMKKLHQRLAETLPCIFLWEAAQVAAFDRSVSGYKLHSYSFYVNPHRWSIEAKRRK